jgi:hypothetical protein
MAEWHSLRGLFRKLQLQRRVSMSGIEGRAVNFATNRGGLRCGLRHPYREWAL